MKSIGLFFASIVLMGIISCSDDEPILSFEDQLAKDIEIIDDYLENEEITAAIHDSGIRYVITEEGNGIKPTLADDVTAKYEGRFLDGKVFDASTLGATFPLSRVIEAWRITVPLISVGGKITIYAPSGYCYGRSGRTGIPKNKILVFDIELIGIQ